MRDTSSSKHALLLLAVLSGAAAATAPAQAEDDGPFDRPPPLVERLTDVHAGFDDGVGGWTSSDGEHALVAEDGHLLVKDITEAWHWLTAPSGFAGDWSDLAAISLRVRGDARATPRHPIALAIRGPAGYARVEVHTRFVARGAWRDLRIPLQPAFWTVKGDWNALMAHVREFRIRLDLYDGTDEMEVQTLDDVRLIARPRSTFAHGLEGWTVTGGSLSLADEHEHLVVTDTGAGWCWLRAPAAFRGDLLAHGRISLRLKADARGDATQPVRIQIEGAGGMAIHQFPLRAVTPGQWRTLEAPLTPAAWAVSGNWREILSDVQDLWIRVDITTEHDGKEVTLVDDIVLAPAGDRP